MGIGIWGGGLVPSFFQWMWDPETMFTQPGVLGSPFGFLFTISRQSVLSIFSSLANSTPVFMRFYVWGGNLVLLPATISFLEGGIVLWLFWFWYCCMYVLFWLVNRPDIGRVLPFLPWVMSEHWTCGDNSSDMSTRSLITLITSLHLGHLKDWLTTKTSSLSSLHFSTSGRNS